MIYYFTRTYELHGGVSLLIFCVLEKMEGSFPVEFNGVVQLKINLILIGRRKVLCSVIIIT